MKTKELYTAPEMEQVLLNAGQGIIMASGNGTFSINGFEEDNDPISLP